MKKPTNNSDYHLTSAVSILLMGMSITFLSFSFVGLLCGVLYAQIIEWFVHGWIQHHPFKIFKSYRDLHTYHHKYPRKPLAVQPVSYFLIGSVALLAPFFWFDGFYLGYFLMYFFINTIHFDLHSDVRVLPGWLWSTRYFRWIESHHEAHHTGKKLGYTTHSVTNPLIDIIFSRIRLTHMNNWIAKNLKI